MKTYITIHLTSGTYTFKIGREINPSIWIPQDSSNIFLRFDAPSSKCTQLTGEAWKFTKDPLRSTLEVYCGTSPGTHPDRIVIYQKEDRDIKCVFDYQIPRKEYLRGQEIIIRIGDTKPEDFYKFNPNSRFT